MEGLRHYSPAILSKNIHINQKRLIPDRKVIYVKVLGGPRPLVPMAQVFQGTEP